METENAIMEKQENSNCEPCGVDEIIEVSDSPSPVDLEVVNSSNPSEASERDPLKPSDVVYLTNDQQEPIDLTFDRSNAEALYEAEKLPVGAPKRIILQSKPVAMVKPQVPFQSNGRGLKRNVGVLNSLPNQAHMQHSGQAPSNYTYATIRPPQTNPGIEFGTRQQEIIKLAKSIFSKRTRTLYHWMYPNASKQLIKRVVASTWEIMSAPERNIYIAQVLGKFDCNNANLMVNPQLGQIRDLPSVSGIQAFNPKASELQNAISSISNETNDMGSCYSNEHPTKKLKVPKKKLSQNSSSASQEFDDDPELKQELAQFSIMMKNQF